MSHPVKQLRTFDRVDATPLWSAIEGRHPGPEIPPPPNHLRRAVVVVSALALFAAAVTFAWSAFHPNDEPPTSSTQEESLQTVENPMDIPIAFSYPNDWIARSVTETTDGLTYGAAVSNSAAAVPTTDPGPMPSDPALPQDFVRVSIFESDRRAARQDSQLPLSMDDAGVVPGPGDIRVLDAQVGGVPITIQVSAGPDASSADLSAADAIVASIRPSTGSEPSETPSPSSESSPALKLRGLPFAICPARSMKGSFGEGIDTAWLFEGEGKAGSGCGDPEDSQYVAVGTPDSIVGMGGRLIDQFSEDASNVSLVATTDIDGDGIDEIAIMSRADQSPTRDAWMLQYDGTYVTQLYKPASGIVGILSYTGGPAAGTSNQREGGAVVVYAQDGTEVAHASFGQGEGFALALDPGTYRVVPTSGDAQCSDQTVDVVAHAHRFAGLHLVCSVK